MTPINKSIAKTPRKLQISLMNSFKQFLWYLHAHQLAWSGTLLALFRLIHNSQVGLDIVGIV